MDLLVSATELSGEVLAPPSKSLAQRDLLLAALADEPTFIALSDSSDDIAAMVRCLQALGASIGETKRKTPEGDHLPGLFVRPLPRTPSGAPVALDKVTLDCKESGATLRFLIPVVGALGSSATFTGAGRLKDRPLEPLLFELGRHGLSFEQPLHHHLPLEISGQMKGGSFELPGDVSSQFISGILLAASILSSPVTLRVRDPFESRPYVTLTLDALRSFHCEIEVERIRDASADSASSDTPCGGLSVFRSPGDAMPRSPKELFVEGDWSQAAFWLAAGALGSPVFVRGLNLKSPQGDRAVMAALALLGVRLSRERDGCAASARGLRGAALDVSNTPDLVPALATVAALAQGTTRFLGAKRLRLKESDRLESVKRALSALGGSASVRGDELWVEGVSELRGGEVDACGDHRIAMMAAILATRSKSAVKILGADCVSKSYPSFFHDFCALGGKVEEV